jgi:hypothetical protein
VGAGSTVRAAGLSGRVDGRSAGRRQALQGLDDLGEQSGPGCVRGQVQTAGTTVLGEAGGDAEQP